jgi:hypothetical protein
MSDDIVARLRELLTAAGSVPWHEELEGPEIRAPSRIHAAPGTYPVLRDCVAVGLLHENAALIVAAINALPKLLDVVEAAQAYALDDPADSLCEVNAHTSCGQCVGCKLRAAVAALGGEP